MICCVIYDHEGQDLLVLLQCQRDSLLTTPSVNSNINSYWLFHVITTQ